MGTVTGFRGRAGEFTVRVASGDAARWTRLKQVVVAPEAAPVEDGAEFRVEQARAYRDRLVLKLQGVDDAVAASGLKGHWVHAPAEEVPELPAGTYWVARLVGLRVVDDHEGAIGTVEDVAATGGVDLLVVEGPAGEEILIPMAGEIVRSVDESRGEVRVCLPKGLLDLRRGKAP